MMLNQKTTYPGAYVDLEKVPHGKLTIMLTAEGKNELAEIEQIRDRYGICAALHAVLEDHFCSGWDEVYPEEVGALTSAMLITDEVVRDDNAELVELGKVYWNPQYMVMDEIRELRKRGFVVFDSA